MKMLESNHVPSSDGYLYSDRDLKGLIDGFNNLYDTLRAIRSRYDEKYKKNEVLGVSASDFSLKTKEFRLKRYPQEFYSFRDEDVCIQIVYQSSTCYHIRSENFNLELGKTAVCDDVYKRVRDTDCLYGFFDTLPKASKYYYLAVSRYMMSLDKIKSDIPLFAQIGDIY